MNNYPRAYKEVLEIVKHFPKDEYEKIPKDILKFYEENMDKDYEFSINPNIELSKQGISKEAKGILIKLFQDYFATEQQKNTLLKIIRLNEMKNDQEKRKKYNPDEIF